MPTINERAKKYRREKKDKGICVVGGCFNPLKTKWNCAECAAKSSFKSNKKRNKNRLTLVEKGLCSNDCGRPLVLKWTCRECADKINKYAKNWWLKDIEGNRIKKNKATRKHRYSGLADIVMERDQKKCTICGHSNKICIHHINEDPKDNRLDNLIVLCRFCHIVVERINRTKPNLIHLFPWSKSL